jgi:trans-2,3-dihydro-3-hydroxyanthranilate isomerase
MPLPSLPYALVDVFAATPFTGNQLAVVFGGDELSAYQMQALASEFNLAETTFPVARTDEDEADGADYRVRIFTSSVELPFAGHPTVGTAWVLNNRGLLASGRRIQACAAGLIEVSVPDDPEGPVELGASPRDCSDPLPTAVAAECAESVGLSGDDVVGGAVIAGCGLSWLHLPVEEDALARVRPRFAPMDEVAAGASLQDQLIGINVFAATAVPGRDRLTVRSRVFVPGVAVAEDPATGSAAVGLGVALVAKGLAAGDGMTTYDIRQGVELGRPSALFGRVQAKGGVATRCWVAGQVQRIGEGLIAVPPDRQD